MALSNKAMLLGRLVKRTVVENVPEVVREEVSILRTLYQRGERSTEYFDATADASLTLDQCEAVINYLVGLHLVQVYHEDGRWYELTSEFKRYIDSL